MNQDNKDQNNKNNEVVDLSKALKNSDTGIKFEEYRAGGYYSQTPKIIQWVIKYSGGLIKNEKQANYILSGFVLLAIIVALVLVFGESDKQITSPPKSYIEKPQFLPNQ